MPLYWAYLGRPRYIGPRILASAQLSCAKQWETAAEVQAMLLTVWWGTGVRNLVKMKCEAICILLIRIEVYVLFNSLTIDWLKSIDIVKHEKDCEGTKNENDTGQLNNQFFSFQLSNFKLMTGNMHRKTERKRNKQKG